MWRCPLCQLPLKQHSRSWSCDNRHTFDQAKSGYLNLLPVQQKKSKQPGDDKTMLNARRHFHDAKGYQPLMVELTKIIAGHCDSTKMLRLYDAGCGEGSYLGFLSQSLLAQGINVAAAGSDIAKHAVDIAAKRFKACQFAVASSVNLPVNDNSLDVVLQVFAPGSDSEYLRVIAEGGILIAVDPAEDHLWSVKQAIYDTPKKHVVSFADKPGFNKLAEQRVSFTVDLSDADTRQALLKMTPYYWRLPQDQAQALLADITRVEADFAVHVWQRHHS